VTPLVHADRVLVRVAQFRDARLVRGGLEVQTFRSPPPDRVAVLSEESLMDINDLPDMLRVDEAADVLRISRSRAYEEVNRYLRTGGVEGLPVIRIGRSLRVLKWALLAWIEAQLGSSHDAA
jgi:hypothetical protein